MMKNNRSVGDSQSHGIKLAPVRGWMADLSALLTAAITLALATPAVSSAQVSGPCCNCHTMHHSQDGAPLNADGPNNVLLVSTCLGCHSASSGDTSIDAITGAPIVFNISVAPTYGDGQGLAGGNFFWVKTVDTKGHNVFSDNPDDFLSTAPGGTTSSCGVQCCHDNLHGTSTIFGIRQGCTKCHMMGNPAGPMGYHHKASADAIVDSQEEGWYRFLDGHMSGTGHGVTGIEDGDWQLTSSAADHNEYLGFSADKTAAGNFSAIGDTMSGFCCGCHGNFHIQQNSGTWVRHPSEAVIPDSGEYADSFGGGAHMYEPLVPVARPSLAGWIGPNSSVALGTDLVTCLSCHRPHGSPYPDMLRWDYDNMLVGGGGDDGTGCFVCHTTKDA